MNAARTAWLSGLVLAAALPSAGQEAPAPEKPRSAVLVAVGDIRLDGPVGAILSRSGPSGPFAGLGEALEGDILLGNLECPLTKRGRPTPGKKWTFRAPPRDIAALKAAGFSIVTVANNHVMDYGAEGLLDTLETLRRAGLPWIGAGRDRDEAEKPRIIEAGGLRVGFLGFTSTFPESAWSGKNRPGVAFSASGRVAAAVRRLRPLCDVLVTVFHGGTELAEEPNDTQRAFAAEAVEAGADLVIGHHPHVVQPLELISGKPVLHSLGNFLFVSPSTGTRTTVAARISLSTRGVEGIAFTPFDINWGAPKPADAEQRLALAERLDRYGALSDEPERFRLAGEPDLPRAEEPKALPEPPHEAARDDAPDALESCRAEAGADSCLGGR